MGNPPGYACKQTMKKEPFYIFAIIIQYTNKLPTILVSMGEGRLSLFMGEGSIFVETVRLQIRTYLPSAFYFNSPVESIIQIFEIQSIISQIFINNQDQFLVVVTSRDTNTLVATTRIGNKDSKRDTSKLFFTFLVRIANFGHKRGDLARHTWHVASLGLVL